MSVIVGIAVAFIALALMIWICVSITKPDGHDFGPINRNVIIAITTIIIAAISWYFIGVK